MLIMTLAYAQRSGNGTLLRKHVSSDPLGLPAGVKVSLMLQSILYSKDGRNTWEATLLNRKISEYRFLLCIIPRLLTGSCALGKQLISYLIRICL